MSSFHPQSASEPFGNHIDDCLDAVTSTSVPSVPFACSTGPATGQDFSYVPRRVRKTSMDDRKVRATTDRETLFLIAP